MMNHLPPQPPLTDAELDASDNEQCVMPVPADAGPVGLRIAGRDPDRRNDYRDQSGRLLGHVLRWDARDGAPKEIRPATFWRNGSGNGGWRLKTWPGKRPLYGLDRLSAYPDAAILLVEGEKAADAVDNGPLADMFTWSKRQAIGMAWPGGVNSIGCADFSPLTGRDVIIVPDNDEPGEQAADELVAALKHVGLRHLRRWRPPGTVTAKWDIADPLPDGVEPGALVEALFAAPAVALPRMIKTVAEFVAEFTPLDYMVGGMVLKHFCYSLTGLPGSGKTAVALLIAALSGSRIEGQRIGPHEIEPGRVVYIAGENADDVRMRLIGMEARRLLDVDPDRFLIIDQVKNLDQEYEQIAREIVAFGLADLVIVDTSPSIFPGDNENDSVQMRDHAKRLRGLCSLPGKPATVALCHPVKNASSPDQLLPRGGGALFGEMDGNLTAWAHDDRLTDLHWCGKIRGPDFAKITFKLPTVTSTKLVDSKGRLLPTVIAEPVTEAEAAASEEVSEDQENRLLFAIQERPHASQERWAVECNWFVEGSPHKPNRFLVARVLKRLEKLKFVAKDGRSFTTTKSGRAIVEKIKTAQ